MGNPYIASKNCQVTVLPMVEVWRHYGRKRKYNSGSSGSGTQYKLL